jgi:hypothetical protein
MNRVQAVAMIQINQQSNLSSTMQTVVLPESQAEWGIRGRASMRSRLWKFGGKMMQTTVRYGAVAAILPAWLMSVAILISVADFNVAQAQTDKTKNRAAAVACGKELAKQCGGVPVRANNMLECLQKDQEKLSKRCVALANNIVRRCDRDAAQRCPEVVAGSGNILGCLTTARRSVSSRCNAALDAVFLRQ